MESIIKIDYVLSRWFSKTDDKIVPGTAFLFLNQLSFCWGILYFILSITLELNKNINLFVGIPVLGVLIIMYGLQRPMENYVFKKNFHLGYNVLPRKSIVFYRVIGLLLMFLSFGLMLLIGIFSIRFL